MRILYITTNFAARTHTFIAREIEHVRRAGCEIELLALRRIPAESQATPPECDINGCRYVYPAAPGGMLRDAIWMALRRPMRFFGAWRKATSDPDDSLRAKFKLTYQLLVACTLVSWLERRGYDRIHAHFASPPATFAMYLSFLTEVPYSFTGHGADVFRDASGLRPKLRYAAGVVCISRYNQEHFRRLAPTLHNAPVIHCGIDLSGFPFAPIESPPPPLAIVAVGRCVRKKGFSVLLQSLRLLHEEGTAWTCTIAGDGPLLPQLRAEALRLGLGNAVIFAGSVPQSTIQDMVRTAHLFVLPSVPDPDGDIDGIPVSLMEAMSAGCPVISTNISGIPELVVDGITGLLVPANDPSALASAIRRIATDSPLRAKLIRNGRHKIEHEFDAANSGAQLKLFFSRRPDESSPAEVH